MQGLSPHLSAPARPLFTFAAHRRLAGSRDALQQTFRFHRSQTLLTLPEESGLQGGTSGRCRLRPNGKQCHAERALLEMLDELPGRGFHQVDMLMEGLSSLSPRRLQLLLADCRSVKVKRLFFWLRPATCAWVKQVDRGVVDLGAGKRALVRGGKLDRSVDNRADDPMPCLNVISARSRS